MECITIAGVSCRVDKLAKISYDDLFRSAKASGKFKGKDIDSQIDKELKKHGFSKTQETTNKVESSDKAKDSDNVQKRSSSKQRRDRKPRKK